MLEVGRESPVVCHELPCHCKQGEGEGVQPQFQSVLFSSTKPPGSSCPSCPVLLPSMPKHAIPLPEPETEQEGLQPGENGVGWTGAVAQLYQVQQGSRAKNMRKGISAKSLCAAGSTD